MLRTNRYLTVALLSAALVAACEPASITAARDQLRRGGSRVVRFLLPMAQDSVTVDVGGKLQFNNLTLSPFNFSFSQMLATTQQTTTITFPAPPVSGAPPADIIYPAAPPPTHFGTAGGSTVVSATVGSGYIVRTFTNGTGCSVDVTTSLTDSLGATIVAFNSGNPVTVANGATLLDSVSAAGKTVSGYAQPGGNATTGVCVPSNPNVSVGVTFRPLALSAVTLKNVNETFSQTFSAFASEPRVTAIDTIIVSTGSFSITVQNRLPIADTITVRLNGITKLVGGAPVVQQQTLVVPAANGTGGTTTSTLTFDLAGARIRPALVIPLVTGVAKAASATITPTNSTNATVVSGGGSIVVQTLYGALNPATTPELTVSLQNSQALPELSSDMLGNLSGQSSVDSATAALVIVNTSGAPLQLSNFALRAAQTDAAGTPLVDGLGNIIYEKNAAGAVISVSVSDPGLTTFTVGRATTRSVTVTAVPLLDRVLDLLLDQKRVALVASGSGIVGDNAQSTISRTDFVKVRFQLTVGVNVTTEAP